MRTNVYFVPKTRDKMSRRCNAVVRVRVPLQRGESFGCAKNARAICVGKRLALHSSDVYVTCNRPAEKWHCHTEQLIVLRRHSS